jgi:cysteinyl-tRNA synthetase
MVVFDALRRWLVHLGYQVTFIRNVTDIDDKIIHNAGHEGMAWWALAQKYEYEFAKADEAIGNIAPTYQPHAAGSVPEIVAFINELVEKGFAYPSEGSVWFSVEKFSSYGALSGQKIADMLASPEQDLGKRSPQDFALWKAAKPDEPSWGSPWGPGRPGWHIECSAMALAYLGESFDIHGGGRDLIFPHHENERAQSNAVGHEFANFWVHNAWVTTAGEKMSKSLGNSLRVSEVLNLVSPIELRYYLLSAHYRSNLEYSPEALTEAATAFKRLQSFLHRAGITGPSSGELDPNFAQAMNSDLATPQAIASLHQLATSGNSALASNDETSAKNYAVQVQAGLAVLGCDPWALNWQNVQTNISEVEKALETLVESLLTERSKARESGDFTRADQIRDALIAAGVALEDSATNTRWSVSPKNS